MKPRFPSGLALASALILCAACATGPERFELDEAGSHGPVGWLELDIPRGWSTSTERAPDFTTHRIEAGGDSGLILQISPIYPDDPRVWVEDTLAKIIASLSKTSIENRLPIRKLAGPGCRASYVSASDRTVDRPREGEFKYVDQGAANLGPLALTFTLLTNDPTGPERAQALEIVRFARFLPSRFSAAWARKHALNEPLVMAIPGRAWGVELNLSGFAIDLNEFRFRRTAMRVSATHETTGMIVSAFLEPARPGLDAAGHREWVLSGLRDRGPLERDVRRFERGDRAILEYRIPIPERGWSQTHRNVYLVHDGYWVDVHMSLMNPGPEAAAQLDAITDSIRIHGEPAQRAPTWDALAPGRRTRK